MSKNFQNAEEYIAARDAFFKSHPEAPEAKDIECLNLLMKREFAEQIVAGTKKLEFRSYSPHYQKRLIDREVADYISMHIDDDDVMMFCNDIRQVKRIHFHNYNNTWYLDIECDFNDVFSITKADIKYLQDTYGCHEYDEDLAYFERVKEEHRPFIFFFVCGNVISTNL